MRKTKFANFRARNNDYNNNMKGIPFDTYHPLI